MTDTVFLWLKTTWKRLFGRTDDFDLTVSLTLFLLWLLFNVLDVIISLMATNAGATEIGILYQLSSDFLAASINKILLAILIGILLVYVRKTTWLSLLVLAMFGLCIHNAYVLLTSLNHLTTYITL